MSLPLPSSLLLFLLRERSLRSHYLFIPFNIGSGRVNTEELQAVQ